MKLNENLKERKMGYIFGGIWIAVTLFYATWDGWIYEWKQCGYNGPNQHFDLNLFDMVWEMQNGQVIYYSTNNLHNIIYLCFFTFLIGVIALITGNEKLRHSTMALLAFPIMAAFATLNPPDHLYIVQIVYDLVHFCGAFIGVYFYYTTDLDIKKAKEGILFTWVIFFVSRLLVQKWPYWAPGNEIGYFSVNQINNMPFYAYGFEYGVVVIILFVVNFGMAKIIEKIPDRKWKALFPFAFYCIVLIIFMAAGLIVIQDIDLGTCP